MTKLDRALQRRILVHLEGLYPNSEGRPGWVFGDVDSDILRANVRYLQEHGLLATNAIITNTEGWQHGNLALTARGADFLADDGGLSALLGVLTVRLHQDTVRELLVAKVETSDAPTSVKAQVVAQIKALPGTALEALTTDALRAGIDHLPAAVQWLQTQLATLGSQ